MNTSQAKLHPGSFKAWILATRPKTLMAAVIPIFVGSLIPDLAWGAIQWGIVFSGLIAAVTLTVATNLINDALDFQKGADTKERIGPLRVTQSGLLSANQVLAAGIGCLLFAILFALPLIFKGGLPIFCLLCLSAIFSYLYTGGPFPLAYKGLGECFVIIFYGFVATSTSYYLQEGRLSWDSTVASLQVGLLSTVLIAINNLRDIEEDSKTGKRTLAVRFGALFGKWEITFLAITPFLINFYWYATDRFLPFFLPMTSFMIAVNLLRGIWRHQPSRLYNRFLGEASFLLTLFGLLLILGFRLGYTAP